MQVNHKVRSNDILRHLNWQPLMERWKEKKAIFMYKVGNGCFVENMTSMFNVANNKHYSLRIVIIMIIVWISQKQTFYLLGW